MHLHSRFKVSSLASKTHLTETVAVHVLSLAIWTALQHVVQCCTAQGAKVKRLAKDAFTLAF
jgi:hypothetical protein